MLSLITVFSILISQGFSLQIPNDNVYQFRIYVQNKFTSITFHVVPFKDISKNAKEKFYPLASELWLGWHEQKAFSHFPFSMININKYTSEK